MAKRIKDRRVIANTLFTSPRTLLYLAERRLADLEYGLRHGGDEAAVAIFEFAMPLNALRPWVSASKDGVVGALNSLHKQPAIAAWADIANAGKHVELREIPHIVSGATTSQKVRLNPAGIPTENVHRYSVALNNGETHDILRLGETALEMWGKFFEDHDIQ